MIKFTLKWKKELKKEYLKNLGNMDDIRKNLPYSVYSSSEIIEYINNNNKFFELVIKKVEEIKLQIAQQELFNLVKSGNIKAIDLFLSRIDKNNDTNSDIKFQLVNVPSDLMDNDNEDNKIGTDNNKVDPNINPDNKIDPKTE